MLPTRHSTGLHASVRMLRIAATLIAALPVALSAQTVVFGIVIDSLAREPLAGAVVQLVGGLDASGQMRSVTADSSGRFQIAGVPAGVYVLGFLHPRLDQLGIEPQLRRLDVVAGVPLLRADLAVPDARTLARALCGPRADTSGVIAGRVIDAETGRPMTTGSVTARWAELTVATRSIIRQPRALRAEVTSEGRYLICALPSTVSMIVQAFVGPARSGEIELEPMPREAIMRDLIISPTSIAEAIPGSTGTSVRTRGTAQLSGHVRGPGGRPLARAQVLLIGTEASTISNESGAYVLDSVPGGTWTLEARALGYAPRHRAVDLLGHRSTTVDLTLDKSAPVIEAVTVYGKSTLRDATGFYERVRRGGFGHYMTADQIETSGVNSVPDLLRSMPGIRVVTNPTSRGGTIVSSRFGGNCLPNVYVDGQPVQDGATALDEYVKPNEVSGIEVYADANTAPVEYSRGSCGSVVVWTKGRVPPVSKQPAK